ncbi:MAG: hypothetical protein IKI93_11045, partial [Clostridia bacterium]|nr:hypothetical protein [Clostridia bacterium]
SFTEYSLGDLPPQKSHPKELLSYLAGHTREELEWGEGIIQHNSEYFKFEVMCLTRRDYTGGMKQVGEPVHLHDSGMSMVPVEPLNQEEWDYVCEYPADGFIFMDQNLNIITISESDIVGWEILSTNYGNISIKLDVNFPVFSMMDTEIEKHSYSTIIITLFDYPSHFEPTAELSIVNKVLAKIRFSFRESNTIGKFIRQIRNNRSMDQNDFAYSIITPYSGTHQHPEISNKTVNKWETGNSYPSLLQLFLLSQSFNFSVKDLLDQFDRGIFVSTMINSCSKVFDIGLSHLFAMNDVSNFIQFLKYFSLTQKRLKEYMSKNSVMGELIYNPDTLSFFDDSGICIKDICVENDVINILLENDKTLTIPYTQNLSIIETQNYGNLVYSAIIRFNQTGGETEIKLNLCLFAVSALPQKKNTKNKNYGN